MHILWPILLCHMAFINLWHALVSLAHTTFTTLQQPDTAYASRTTIPHDRVCMFTACALHYNLDMASVIRFVGGTYTASYRNVPHILQTLENTQLCDNYLLSEVKRVMTIGDPSQLTAASSKTNFLAYFDYGNHKSITKNLS